MMEVAIVTELLDLCRHRGTRWLNARAVLNPMPVPLEAVTVDALRNLADDETENAQQAEENQRDEHATAN